MADRPEDVLAKYADIASIIAKTDDFPTSTPEETFGTALRRGLIETRDALATAIAEREAIQKGMDINMEVSDQFQFERDAALTSSVAHCDAAIKAEDERDAARRLLDRAKIYLSGRVKIDILAYLTAHAEATAPVEADQYEGPLEPDTATIRNLSAPVEPAPCPPGPHPFCHGHSPDQSQLRAIVEPAKERRIGEPGGGHMERDSLRVTPFPAKEPTCPNCGQRGMEHVQYAGKCIQCPVPPPAPPEAVDWHKAGCDAIDNMAEAAAREKARADEAIGIGPGMNDGPRKNCSNCGRRMVWQYVGDSPSWMCPNCVLLGKRKAEAEATALRERGATIVAVYERFKHLDQLLSDSEWMGGDQTRRVCRDLWMSVKAAAPAPEKGGPDV